MFEKKTFNAEVTTVVPMGIDIKIKDNPFRNSEVMVGVSVYFMVDGEKRPATPSMVSIAKDKLAQAIDKMRTSGQISEEIADTAKERLG